MNARKLAAQSSGSSFRSSGSVKHSLGECLCMSTQGDLWRQIANAFFWSLQLRVSFGIQAVFVARTWLPFCRRYVTPWSFDGYDGDPYTTLGGTILVILGPEHYVFILLLDHSESFGVGLGWLKIRGWYGLGGCFMSSLQPNGGKSRQPAPVIYKRKYTMFARRMMYLEIMAANFPFVFTASPKSVSTVRIVGYSTSVPGPSCKTTGDDRS